MQPKNVMLLGFVNKAAEYLDQNLEEEANNSKLATLKHIDFAKIKKELSDNLDASLGIMQSTMTSLLTAGSDAFNEFLYSDDHETLAQQMAREFDFDFDEVKDDKKDLDELLSFYNLDKKFEETEEEIVLEKSLEESTEIDFDSTEIIDEKTDLIDALNKETSIEEETKACELDDESLELMELIQSNITKVNNGTFEKYEQDDIDDEINEIFSEIELNAQDDEFEELLNTIEDEVINEEVVEVKNEPLIENKVDFDGLYKERFLQDSIIKSILNAKVIDLVLPKVIKEEVKPSVDFEELVKEKYLQDKIIESILNVSYDTQIPFETLVEAIDNETVCEVPVEVLVENVSVRETGNDLNSLSDDLIEQLRAQMIKEDEETKQNQLEAIKEEAKLQDEIIDSILNNDYIEEEKVNSYLEGLIDNLKDQMIKEDEETQRIKLEKEKAYNQIKEAYSNLSAGFISTVYDLKEEIANNYKEDEKVIVLHRLVFDNIDNLRQFIEIVLEHNYQVNVDESKFIVDTFKQFVNKDGKILSNIFEVANQAKALGGEYEGYRVIECEEE